MKGHDKIIELLNDVLSSELTAVNQYWIHARMCADWGYQKLWTKVRSESIDEMKHADAVIERILYLEGVPNMQRQGSVSVGQTVLEQLNLDLKFEIIAIDRLNKGTALCRKLGDDGTYELLHKILVDEEVHADWLESQLDLIEQTGLQNYLAAQIGA